MATSDRTLFTVEATGAAFGCDSKPLEAAAIGGSDDMNGGMGLPFELPFDASSGEASSPARLRYVDLLLLSSSLDDTLLE